MYKLKDEGKKTPVYNKKLIINTPHGKKKQRNGQWPNSEIRLHVGGPYHRRRTALEFDYFPCEFGGAHLANLHEIWLLCRYDN